MEQISIPEAKQQLQDAQDEVARIRSRIAELRAGDNAIDRARREREMAEALMAGGDVAEIVAPPLSSAQIKHAIQVLESALSGAIEREAQAAGALRAARVRRMRELFEQRKSQYDVQARDLLKVYAEVTALGNAISAAVGGVHQMPMVWHRLELPKAIVDVQRDPFAETGLHTRGSEVMGTTIGASAAAEVKAMLRKEGIE